MSTLHRIAGCDDNSHRADVLFLHGLGGDAFATWRHGKDESTSWPHWLGEESPDVRVWSLGYAASPTKRFRWLRRFWAKLRGRDGRDIGQSMPLPDRAGQVLDRMVQLGFGQRPIQFICHSLGGLLAKQILRKAADSTDPRRQAVFSSTRAVLFLATPHTGAELASLLNAFQTVFGTTVSIEDLRAHDAHLRELFNWYRNHSAPGIVTKTYFETREVLGVRIVNESSAHPGVGADPDGLDEDHLSIAKPRKRDDQVCVAARELLLNHVLASRVLPPPPAFVAVAPAPPNAPPALPVVVKLDLAAVTRADDGPRPPCLLPTPAEQFFGRVNQRNKLLERLRAAKNTAVVGPAGMGKTALAAEAIIEMVGRNGEYLAGSPFPDGILFLDLYQAERERRSGEVPSEWEHSNLIDTAWHRLANSLAGSESLPHRNDRPRELAQAACHGKRLLLVIEGGEVLDPTGSAANIRALLSVLPSSSRWLLLTREQTQALPVETIRLDEPLSTAEAGQLFDAHLTGARVEVQRA